MSVATTCIMNSDHHLDISLVAESVLFLMSLYLRGMWEDDEWIQSAADPALTRIKGPGLSRASAGQEATFIIKVCAYLAVSSK